MSAADLETLLVQSADHRGRSSQLRRVYGIEEYLFIGGSRMTVPAAAKRLGVTERTVYRWRAVLRGLAGRGAA